MQGTIRSMLIAMVALIVVTVAYQVLTNTVPGAPPPTPTLAPTDIAPVPSSPDTPYPQLTVKAQKLSPGGIIVVAKVVTRGPGWVSIHLNSNNNSPASSYIGVVSVKKGTSLNVRIPVSTKVQLTQVLWAFLHNDAGQIGKFEFPGPDSLARTSVGSAVRISFQFLQ